MSGLVVLPSPGAFDRRIAEADFGFYVAEPDAPGLRILQYYSPYHDLVVSPQMLDDFESDIRNHEDDYSVYGLPGYGLPGEHSGSKATAVLPFIEVARLHDAYLVLVGD